MLFRLAFLLCIPFFLSSIEFQSIKVGDVMSEAEQRETGVHRLTTSERRQLEVWLTNYTLKLNAQPQGSRGQELKNSTVQGDLQIGVADSYKPLGKVLNVDHVYEEGASLYLSDGSIWTVMEDHHKTAFKWDTGTRVAIYRSRDPRFPYRLVNLSSGNAINAQVQYGPADAKQTQDERPDPSLKTVEENVEEGAYLLMEDGSRWVISPWDRYKAKLWLRGEQVKVSRSGGIVYPYRLTNTNTDESAEAKLQQGAPVRQPATLPQKVLPDS